MGNRDSSGLYRPSVVRGFTLIEVVIAFTIALLAIVFLQHSLSLIAQRLYIMKKQERDLEVISHIQNIFNAQLTSLATLLDHKDVDGKACQLMSYQNFNYYVCPQDFGVQRIYLSNGYSFLIYPR